MSQFKKNLEELPSVAHLASLDVVSVVTSDVVVSIENKPGKSGSLAVYAYLGAVFSVLNADAAQRGLALFAEYTDEAKREPGSHPNIDFLFKVIEEGAEYRIQRHEKPVHS